MTYQVSEKAVINEITRIYESQENALVSYCGLYRIPKQRLKFFEVGIYIVKGRNFVSEGECQMHEYLEINTPYIFVLVSNDNEVQVFHNKSLVLNFNITKHDTLKKAYSQAQSIVNKINAYLETCE